MRNLIEKLNSVENEIDLEEIRSIIEKKESLPENKRIDPRDFINVQEVIDGKKVDLFPTRMINGDLAEVEEKRKRIFEQKEKLPQDRTNANTIANLVEISIPEAIKKLNWLGEKIKMIRPSLYDDYFRGIDNIVQMMPEEIVKDEKDLKCVGFSIDFTISDMEARKKVLDVSLSIAKGKTPSVKYFSTDIMTEDGSKNIKIRDFKIPKVIMSCPNSILNESEEDMINFEKNPDDNDAKKNAENTTLRYHFIRESLEQLKFFADLAGKLGNNNAKNVYENSLQSFSKIIEDQGIDSGLLDEKLNKIPSLMKNVDLNADNGKFIKMLKDMKEVQ